MVINKKYIAKPDTWFKEGTECKLLDDYSESFDGGLFEGIIIDENGNEKIDEEICDFNEFNIIE